VNTNDDKNETNEIQPISARLLAPVTGALLKDPPDIPDERILKALAHLLWSDGRIHESLTCLALLEEREELKPPELQLKGYWQLYSGDVEGARKTFAAALKQDNTRHPTSRLGYAYALFHSKDYASAEDVFQRLANEGSSLRSPALMAAASRAMSSGELPKEVPIAPVPGLPPGMSNVLQTKILSGYEGALQQAHAHLTSLPASEQLPLQRLMVELYLNSGQDQEAVALVDKLVASYENDGSLLVLKGMALRGIGKREESHESFLLSTFIAPLDSRGWAGYAAGCLEGGAFDKATKAYRIAVFLDGNNPSYWGDLGISESELKNYSQGRSAISKSIELGLHNFTNYFNRGVCSLYLNEFTDALNDWQMAITIEPQNPRAAEAEKLIQNTSGPPVDNRFVFGDVP